MSVDNLYFLADNDLSEDGEKRKHRWHSRFSVDDEEWDIVDFKTIGKVSNSGSCIVLMGYNDDLMSPITELGGELVDVGFDSS
jgi:hypothetical protein